MLLMYLSAPFILSKLNKKKFEQRQSYQNKFGPFVPKQDLPRGNITLILLSPLSY